MIVAQLTIVPIGTGKTSLSKYVKIALEELKKDERIKIRVGAMSTAVEAENLEIIFDVTKKAHEAVFGEGVQRVLTTLTIDDRRDKEISIESKLKAVE